MLPASRTIRRRCLGIESPSNRRRRISPDPVESVESPPNRRRRIVDESLPSAAAPTFAGHGDRGTGRTHRTGHRRRTGRRTCHLARPRRGRRRRRGELPQGRRRGRGDRRRDPRPWGAGPSPSRPPSTTPTPTPPWSTGSPASSDRSRYWSTTPAGPAGATRWPTPTRTRPNRCSPPTPSAPTTCAGHGYRSPVQALQEHLQIASSAGCKAPSQPASVAACRRKLPSPRHRNPRHGPHASRWPTGKPLRSRRRMMENRSASE